METQTLLIKPRRSSGLFYTLRMNNNSALFRYSMALCLIAGAFALNGCGVTSPRFGGGEKRKSTPPEEIKVPSQPNEEDKETKSDEAENVLSGKRSFKTEKNAALSNLDQSKIMRQISKLMGTSYKLGGETEEGIDCSAYTMLVYKNSINKQLPRTSAEQFKIGNEVEFEGLKFGDLVFFNTTGEPASHVGVYLGDDLFAHASVSLGVTISSLESFYYKKRYEGARRIVH